jgi:hypothetical protein
MELIVWITTLATLAGMDTLEKNAPGPVIHEVITSVSTDTALLVRLLTARFITQIYEALYQPGKAH